MLLLTPFVSYSFIITFAFIVILSWLASHAKKKSHALLMAVLGSLIYVLVINIVFSSDTIKNEFYWYWDLPSFLLKSLSILVILALVFLFAGYASWKVSANMKKPWWVGLLVGIMAGVVAYIPAGILGIIMSCMLTGDCL
jgi:hypothetical protein